ncbi:MAG: DEAD/DEAH box helicase [Janthinobacterium lividum]
MTTDCATAAALTGFHPAVANWFRSTFPAATQAQQRAWPLIRRGRSTLVAAPTGSGKTLTAFLAALDELVQEGLARGGVLPDATTVVYVSPLKALSNDIRVNLEAPLAGINAELAKLGLPDVAIRTAVRTGDTPQRERLAMRKTPPHILVTTPESLYVLMSSDSGRQMLASTRTVIVDEIHAIVGNKRGSHLALTLERLQALCEQPPTRIGLSATQKPIGKVAEFLVGRSQRDCAIVDVGHARQRDLALDIPPVPLEAVMANEVWERVYDRLADLTAQHRTTLVFVNTRRMAERAARHLSDRLGTEAIAAHHGSMSKEHRLDAEQRLKRGELRVLIATASLELGIDIGEVDLVCQLGSPKGIAPFLQRVGRAGHQVGGISKGRLFPVSRDDLIECAALLDCVRRGELDTLSLPKAPLDVLAQQIVAEVACQEWSEDALFELVHAATPYAELPRESYDAVLRMLAEGYTSRHGPRGAWIHRDAVSRTLRGRRGGKLTAVMSGGTIPDNADFTVLLEPQGLPIGTVNEDFAVESLAGDVFQLGNVSYRIMRVEAGRVRVENAHGQPPNIPFWLGEAPGRSNELSAGVARLREHIDGWLGEADQATQPGAPALDYAIARLSEEVGLEEPAARQIVEYLARARAALGVLPTQRTLVMERFFDESGGAQLVIHAPFGSRINRAWGLALRKRFCRNFNFELQAAATEDAIVLSLSTQHSFPLDEVWRYLRSASAEHLLIQALLDAPLFGVRWRWNATTALALPRFTGGRRVAPQLQRMRSEDLLATIFPDQVACLENIVGERELPSHPLVDQTIDDCLHEAMDSEGWLAVLRSIERGDLQTLSRDLPAPSPLAAEILNARPYAFLDDAPLEERRTRAVLNRRWTDPGSADDLGALDADAIASVADEAWPQVRSVDEMHEALMGLACITTAEVARNDGWARQLAALADTGRATQLQIALHQHVWLAAERLACLRAVYPQAALEPPLAVLPEFDEPWTEDDALVDIIRARLTGFGPQPLGEIARALALPASAVAIALTRLESEGYVMRGRFSPGATQDEWCERHLLARIHRYTVKRLRREIEPVPRQDFMRFLFDWQHVTSATRSDGRASLDPVMQQLEGFQAAAAAWESDILPARLNDYSAQWLDDLCRAGKIVWTRLGAPAHTAAGPVRGMPIVFLPRRELATWDTLIETRRPTTAPPTTPTSATSATSTMRLSSRAQAVYDALARHGAMFFDELTTEVRLLREELENALGELVAMGLVSADSFAGLRALLTPAARRATHSQARRRRIGAFAGGLDDAGRWALLRRPVFEAVADSTALTASSASASSANSSKPANASDTAARTVATRRATGPTRLLLRPKTPPPTLEHIAWVLLRRYGVVFWHVLEREADWLPAWRELLDVYHRMEARGEIRGGRFVDGLSGEQFALPEAIPLLRETRRRAPDDSLVCIAATDPLNLCGTLLPGQKVPAVVGNRIAFINGVAVAARIAGAVNFLTDFDATAKETVRTRLNGSYRLPISL